MKFCLAGEALLEHCGCSELLSCSARVVKSAPQPLSSFPNCIPPPPPLLTPFQGSFPFQHMLVEICAVGLCLVPNISDIDCQQHGVL